MKHKGLIHAGFLKNQIQKGVSGSVFFHQPDQITGCAYGSTYVNQSCTLKDQTI